MLINRRKFSSIISKVFNTLDESTHHFRVAAFDPLKEVEGH